MRSLKVNGVEAILGPGDYQNLTLGMASLFFVHIRGSQKEVDNISNLNTYSDIIILVNTEMPLGPPKLDFRNGFSFFSVHIWESKTNK